MIESFRRFKILIAAYILSVSYVSVWAQHVRMWVPSETGDYYYQLKENNVRLQASDLYSAERPSLNDAIVQFNGGCTGEIISPRGLVLTNHHCGYGAIAAHSTLEHNYVEDGFWAQSQAEELPNPGMYVTFVRKIIDVTGEVLQGVTPDMDARQRQSVTDRNINRLKKTLPHEAWQDISIKPFFYGNKYYAFVEENYRDIRLVGAPPSSIGKFGADTDNWMWPRHSGDFSLFRIYADKNNRPAEYSPDNVPYRPDRYLKVSTEGVHEGDMIIVYGFPGRTQEYLPSFRVAQITGKINPVRIGIRRHALDVLDKFMRRNDTLKLKYTSTYARIANYWKKWKGENMGIRRSGAIAEKKHWEEEVLRREAETGGHEVADILQELKAAYDSLEAPELARNVFIEAGYVDNPWMQYALDMYRFERQVQRRPEKFDELKSDFYEQMKNKWAKSDARVNRALFLAMWQDLNRYMPEKYKPSSWEIPANKSSHDKVSDNWQHAVFTDSLRLKKALEGGAENFLNVLKNDSAYKMARGLIDSFYNDISPDYARWQNKTVELMRSYQSHMMKLFPGFRWAPDANGTLRVTFGEVRGYEPRDGVYYEPFSTLDGVIEKYIPGDYEFDLPEKLLDIYKHKDFGKYAVNGTVPVNFLGTAHTTGGNSGSPALNAKGELVGLNFDRVWEGTMSDLYYDPSICRNIMVDIRYVLFIMDKLGDASRLVHEILQN